MLFHQEARAQTDSLHYDLDGIVHLARKNDSSVKKVKGGLMDVNLDRIQHLPKVMGNTDPLSFVRMLPGVQAGSEYDSGINIQGCDNSHNDFSISGVPIYGASHLFGLFSVFNPSHYEKMIFGQSVPSGTKSRRLGGVVRMELPDSIQRRISGELSIGMMSSQGTLRFKTGKKSFFHLSARLSYLDMLYGRWLMMDNSPFSYSFGDYNLTWFYAPSEKDDIWVDIYTGYDKAYLGADSYNLNLDFKWGNRSAAIHWNHKDRCYRLRQTVFVSGFNSDGLLTQNPSSMSITSAIASVGYRATVELQSFSVGADLTGHNVLPQFPQHEGIYGGVEEREIQRGLEADVWANYKKEFASGIGVLAGIGADAYMSPEKNIFLGLTPMLAVSWNSYRFGIMSFTYSRDRQNLFQTGMSNIALPMDFWFMAGKYSSPQTSHSFSLAYNVELMNDELSLSANIYSKHLAHQVEYHGSLFDLFNTRYDLDNHLLTGTGHNYGINLMLHKQAGAFTGWVSYSLGRALRYFDNPDYPDVYPANHERIHDLSAVASYNINKWNLSGNFIFASGRPFTASEAYYITAGTIMTKYGDHNACRLRPYVRMDISVNRILRKRDNMENGINFSVYNVLARKNDVMWRLSVSEGKFAYRPVSFFLRLMPSVSYYHKF